MATRKERRRAFEVKLAGMRAAYVRDLPDRIAAMRASAAAGDYREVARLAHALRGTGGSYGLRELVSPTLALEEACEQSDDDAVREHLDAIEALAEAFRAPLD